MIFVKIASIAILSNLIVYNIGFFFLKNRYDIYETIFIGFSLLLLFLSFGYFVFDLNVYYLRNTLIIVSILFFIYNLKNKNFISEYFRIFYVIIIPVLFYSLYISLYGEQFFIFRGNHYDSLNYTSLSVMMNNYSYSEILLLINSPENFKVNVNKLFYLKNAVIYFDGRPLVSLLNSLFYISDKVALYEANFIFKIFLLLFVPISTIKFFKIFNNNSFINFLFSQLFTFSFWVFYIMEIDANSQLSVIGISIFITAYIIENYNFLIIRDWKKITCLSLLFSVFFSLYIEQAILFTLIFVIFLIIKNFTHFKNYNLYLNSFLIIFIFLIFLYPHKYLLGFIIQQTDLGINSNNDWWGYYGAFILGAKSIVTDQIFVENIKSIIKSDNFFEVLKYIHLNNVTDNNQFYYLNIIPSFFGLYHLNNLFDERFIYLAYFINVLITFGIIYLVSSSLVSIINDNSEVNILFKTVIIFSITFFLILIINLSFWSVIKFYFYISFFLFILISNLLDKQTNKLKIILSISILLLSSTVPIYKYSIFNFGIGKYDSFPSIIDKDLKMNINWEFKLDKLKFCEKIYIKSYDRYINTIISSKLTYNNLNEVEFVNQFDKNDKNCNLNIKNDSY